MRFNGALHDRGQAGGFQFRLKQKIMRSAHRDQAGCNGCFRLPNIGCRSHALPHDGGDHGQHVFHAVMNFLGQYDLESRHLVLDCCIKRGLFQPPGEVAILLHQPGIVGCC